MKSHLIYSLVFGLLVQSCSNRTAVLKSSCSHACNSNESQIINASSMTTTSNQNPVLIPACQLTSKKQRERMEKLGKTIFKDIDSIQAVENGFIMIFNKPIEYSNQLLEFINFERECCPSLEFSLNFLPNQGPIHLKIIGSKEMQEQVISGMRDYGHF